MKKLLPFRSLLLVVALLVTLVTISQGTVVITTTASVGPPPISSSYGSYTWSVLYCLSTGASPTSYSPSYPDEYSFAPNELHWGDITVDNSGQSVWLGEVITDPLSRFYGEKGTAFYVNAIFAGDGIHKFCADNISYQVMSNPSTTLSGSGTLAGLTYGVGPIFAVDYGPNHVLGGGDDINYNPSHPISGNTLVDKIFYAGVAVAFDATTFGLSNVESYVKSAAPFDLTVSYTVNDGTGIYGSRQTRTVVPEPTAIGLLSIGAISLIRRKRSK